MSLAQFALAVKCSKIEMETQEVKMIEHLLKTDEMLMSKKHSILSYHVYYAYGIVGIFALT